MTHSRWLLDFVYGVLPLLMSESMLTFVLTMEILLCREGQCVELYSIPVDENLFYSVLAGIFGYTKVMRKTYHHSDWGENRASDEKKWWLSVEDTGSDWMIHLFDDQKLTDSYRCLLDDQHSSWEAKTELQTQLRDWLVQNGKTLGEPPTICWAISIGKTKNSHDLFALRHGVVGIDFNILLNKKIGDDFVLTDALAWTTFEDYCRSRFDDAPRPTSAMNQSIAFLSRIRSGDRLIALKDTSPIWVGRFSDHDIDTVQKHELNHRKHPHIFRSVEWEPVLVEYADNLR